MTRCTCGERCYIPVAEVAALLVIGALAAVGAMYAGLTRALNR